MDESPGLHLLCIGDLYLPGHSIARQVRRALNGAGVVSVDWPLADLSELAARNRSIELYGPEAAPLGESAETVVRSRKWDAIITHFAPLASGALEQLAPYGWVGVLRGGMENVDLRACQARGVAVVNTPGRNANGVAEFTLGLILAETRHIARAHAALQRGVWEKEFGRPLPRELCEMLVGVVGYGAVGRLVVEKVLALGATVLIYDPFVGPAEAPGEHEDRMRFVELVGLLRASDVVTLHARYTGDTPLIGREELAQMKPGAILVNTARAQLVDERALAAALACGSLAGAALDVFSEEPPPPDAPWTAMDAVTVTPHLGGATADAFRRSPAILLHRLRDFTHCNDRRGVVLEPRQAEASVFKKRWGQAFGR